MNTYKRILLLASCIIAAAGTTHGQPGRSGLSFLKIGVSGQGVAMGGAMSAHVSGVPATYYNPAGLVLQTENGPSAQLMVMHTEWIQDTRSEFLGAAINVTESNAVGISLNSTTVSDIEIRTRPGAPEGSFTARNYSLGASYSHRLTEHIRFGLTGKFLYEKILIDEASGYAVDVGAQYDTPVENLTVGLALANLGGMTRLRDEKTRLPSLLRAGSAFRHQIAAPAAGVTVASDFVHYFDEGKSYLTVAGEIIFEKSIAARAGYQLGSDGRGFSTGVGLFYGILALDYAFTPVSFDLGNSHSLSLAINF